MRDIVGVEHSTDDPELTAGHRRDWTGRYQAPATVAVHPGTSEEVAAIVSWCVEHDVAIVPQGGNTGLVGGSVPLSGELLVSTGRLVGVEAVTSHAGDLTAGAGTPIATLQHTARRHGWEYGVDLASRESATLGGTVATNAGGIRVMRYGDTRRQVIGVELVTGTGEIVSDLGGTLRDNTGYHLPSLVTGSEGTIGIVTRARVRLVPRFRNRTAALIRFPVERDAVEAAESLRGALPSVESVELFFAAGLRLVCSAFDVPPPFEETAGGYILVEVAGNGEVTSDLADVVGALPKVGDIAVAEDSTTRERLWRYRELHSEAIATVGVPHKLDVALPPGRFAEFIDRVPELVTSIAADARTWMFGHGGEGAVHVNVTGLAPDDESVDTAVLRLVAQLDGSISAEHGIGRAKMRWIHLAHDASELRLLSRVKAAFDPAGIMNPAVLVPPG